MAPPFDGLDSLCKAALRARDHYTLSTLIDAEGGAGPSSLLQTRLEGPTEYLNARWIVNVIWTPT